MYKSNQEITLLINGLNYIRPKSKSSLTRIASIVNHLSMYTNKQNRTDIDIYFELERFFDHKLCVSEHTMKRLFNVCENMEYFTFLFGEIDYLRCYIQKNLTHCCFSYDDAQFLIGKLCGKKILSIGCGKGMWESYFHDNGIDIKATDINGTQIDNSVRKTDAYEPSCDILKVSNGSTFTVEKIDAVSAVKNTLNQMFF